MCDGVAELRLLVEEVVLPGIQIQVYRDPACSSTWYMRMVMACGTRVSAVPCTNSVGG